jgi:hypothetical protein
MRTHNIYTHDEVIKILSNNGFEFIDKEKFTVAYKNIFVKDIDGYLYKITFSDFLLKILKGEIIFEKFGKNNPFTIINIKLWLEKNTELELVSTEYPETRRKNLTFKCKNCKRSFVRRWDMMRNMKHCVFCYQETPPDSRSFIKNFPDIAEEWDYDKNNGIDINKIYSASNKKYWWKCKQCGYSFYTKLSHRTLCNVGCAACNTSGAVKKICSILKSEHINFDIEYSFDDLFFKSDRPLRYDFAIFDNFSKNVLALVEYDDIQHEKFVPYFHKTEIKFYDSVKRDEKKNKYAKDNNIPLLRITYKDKNIKEVLMNFIKALS